MESLRIEQGRENRSANVGRAEQELLDHIAAHGGATVRQAADHFGETKGYVRTTLLQMMERLRKKGFLTREVADGVYVYKTVISREALQRNLLDRFVDESLSGSLAPLVVYLAEADRVTDSELDQLRKLVSDLEARREGDKP